MNTHTVRKSLWIASGVSVIILTGIVSYGLSKSSEPKTELVPAVTIERSTTTMEPTTVKPKVTTQKKVVPTTVPTTSTSQPTTTTGPATTLMNIGGTEYEVYVECQTACPDKNAATSTTLATSTTDNEANGDDTVNRGPNYLAPYQGK